MGQEVCHGKTKEVFIRIQTESDQSISQVARDLGINPNMLSRFGSCADSAACEGFFGMLKRERVNRHRYRTRAAARADIFDYIERFHNPRKRWKLEMRQREELLLTQPPVESG
jgi:transposase InsO family protein